MLKKFIFCALIIFCGYGISLADGIKNILIISIDALHPDALTLKTSKNIYRLMVQGTYTLKGHSTNPPLTLLAHAAMFSGVSPKKSGKTDNAWQTGQPKIKSKTIFDLARSKGYSTGYFYSKEKLGYLVNKAVDQHKLDKNFSLENAFDFFKDSKDKRFCFLHISGLDRVGPIDEWMSPGYLEELFFIDETIADLINMIESRKNYLIIITSDHAGHGTIHGSDHSDDARLPLVMISDTVSLIQYQGVKYHVTELKPILEKILCL